MSIIDWLLGRRADPTLQWQERENPLPEFDIASRRFCSLKFGDPLEHAQAFGRPTAFRSTHRSCCILIYADSGYQLEFEDDTFDCVTLFLGPDEYLPEGVVIQYCHPLITGWQGDAIRLSRETTSAQLEQQFGAPTTRDVDEEETVSWYTDADLTIEFEANAVGCLKRITFYLTPAGSK